MSKIFNGLELTAIVQCCLDPRDKFTINRNWVIVQWVCTLWCLCRWSTLLVQKMGYLVPVMWFGEHLYLNISLNVIIIVYCIRLTRCLKLQADKGFPFTTMSNSLGVLKASSRTIVDWLRWSSAASRSATTMVYCSVTSEIHPHMEVICICRYTCRYQQLLITVGSPRLKWPTVIFISLFLIVPDL